jgi:hypothetical protein
LRLSRREPLQRQPQPWLEMDDLDGMSGSGEVGRLAVEYCDASDSLLP